MDLSFDPPTNPFIDSEFGGSTIFMPEVGAFFFQSNNPNGRRMVGGPEGGLVDSLRTVQLSSTLSPGTFSGIGTLYFTAGSSGTRYVGFKDGPNVGWFSFSVAGLGTDIHYLEGRYGNAGENVHVPAPGALALLALGAVGVRRKRRRAA